MPEVVGNVDQVRTGPGRWLACGHGLADLPQTIDEDIDPLFIEIGFVVGNTEWTIDTKSDGVKVANRIRPIRYENTSSEFMVKFSFAQISPDNLMIAIGGGTKTTNGSTIKYSFPRSGGQNRISFIWESEDGLERLCVSRAFSTGSITIPRGEQSSVDVAVIPVEFSIEEDSALDEDVWYLYDSSLAA